MKKKKDFIASHIQKKGWNKGFTLAETLIALAVIGIVAAIMIPALSYLIQTKVRERQVEVAKLKLNKALEQMVFNEKLGPQYADTLDFVNELKKHFKINHICRVGDSPSELPPVTSCFGDNYENVHLTDGTDFPLKDIKTGAQFKLNSDASNDWSSDNIAFIVIDGTRFLVSHNTKCTQVVYDKGIFRGKEISQNCLSGLVDVDGDKKPNTLNKDVFLFGMAQTIGNSCATGSAQGLCFSTPVAAANFLSTTYDECVAIKNKYGVSQDICGPSQNWYAGLVDYCGGQDKIVSSTDLAPVVSYLYNTNITADKLLYQQGAYWLPDINESRLEEYGLNGVTHQLVMSDLITDNNKQKALTIWLDDSQILAWDPASLYNGSAYDPDFPWVHELGNPLQLYNAYTYCKL